MTIASLPIETNPTLNSSSLGMAIIAKSLDAAETAGQGMINMMEQSVNPNLGTNIDLKV